LTLGGLGIRSGRAQAPTKVTLGTNWKAQAEHGGFYQALAAGIYAKHGLDVTIRMGGPQVNHSQLLAAGAIDFNMGADTFNALNYVKNNVPMVCVAAIFQKDPRVLIAHPGQGNDSLPALKGKPILIAASSRATYWQYLKAAYGYSEDQVRPYTFNIAPFLADKTAIQQGFLTSEPLQMEKAGVKPVVMLLADSGYASYANTIETSWKRVTEEPDLVQRFVNASIEGWYSYLYKDPSPGNALIKKDNPDMSDEQITYSIGKIKQYGMIDSGDATKGGIGAMSDDRYKAFHKAMTQAGMYPADLDLSKAYTLRFVNKGYGLNLKS
jgi:NitT/TauT family transport system substrate-binding protein